MESCLTFSLVARGNTGVRTDSGGGWRQVWLVLLSQDNWQSARHTCSCHPVQQTLHLYTTTVHCTLYSHCTPPGEVKQSRPGLKSQTHFYSVEESQFLGWAFLMVRTRGNRTALTGDGRRGLHWVLYSGDTSVSAQCWDFPTIALSVSDDVWRWLWWCRRGLANSSTTFFTVTRPDLIPSALS